MSPSPNTRDDEHWTQIEEAADLLDERDYEKALLALRTVIGAHPENPYAFNLLGAAFFELRKFPEARDAYRAAVRIAPDFVGARVSLSHALRATGDAKGALAEANEAVRRFPKDGDAHHAAGLAHAALGQRKDAQRELEGFLSSGPEFEAETEVRQIMAMLGLGPEGEPIDFE